MASAFGVSFFFFPGSVESICGEGKELIDYRFWLGNRIFKSGHGTIKDPPHHRKALSVLKREMDVWSDLMIDQCWLFN